MTYFVRKGKLSHASVFGRVLELNTLLGHPVISFGFSNRSSHPIPVTRRDPMPDPRPVGGVLTPPKKLKHAFANAMLCQRDAVTFANAMQSQLSLRCVS